MFVLMIRMTPGDVITVSGVYTADMYTFKSNKFTLATGIDDNKFERRMAAADTI